MRIEQNSSNVFALLKLTYKYVALLTISLTRSRATIHAQTLSYSLPIVVPSVFFLHASRVVLFFVSVYDKYTVGGSGLCNAQPNLPTPMMLTSMKRTGGSALPYSAHQIWQVFRS
jgi:hypothetical protein